MYNKHLNRLTIIGGCLLLCAVLMTGCAQPQHVEKCVTGDTCGFLSGLWHGFIAPFSFILSLFDEDVTVWATNNNGNWYTFGFLLGSGVLVGGTSTTVNR